MGENLLPDLETYARDFMANPNRFETDWMTNARALLDADSAQAREKGTLATAEWAAKRGLTGSSYEGEQRVALEDQIDRNRLEQQMELLEAMAMVESEDRLAAGNFGLDVGEFGQGLGRDRRDEALTSHEAERQRILDDVGRPCVYRSLKARAGCRGIGGTRQCRSCAASAGYGRSEPPRRDGG
jgi:hypothetical protein